MPVARTVKKGALTGLTAAFSLLNLVVFAVTIGLAASLFESWSNGEGLTPRLFSAPRASSIALLMFSLLASSVGAATSLLGLVHASAWNETARYANLAGSMITLPLTWLAGGFAIRVYKGDTGSMNEFAVKLRTLGAFSCIGALLMLLYVLHLGLFKHRADGAPTVAAHNNTAPVTTQKRVDDHHHNAAMNA